MENKFHNIVELIENVKHGGEVEFIYNNNHYSITHFGDDNEHKISVMQAYNTNSQMILDFSELTKLGEYMVENQKLKHIISKCQIVFRCF